VLSALPACCCPSCPLWVTVPARALLLLLLLCFFGDLVLSWFHEPSNMEVPPPSGLEGVPEPAVLVVSWAQELSAVGEVLLVLEGWDRVAPRPEVMSALGASARVVASPPTKLVLPAAGRPQLSASSSSWQQPAPLPYQTQLPKVVRLSMRQQWKWV
jgi:hypothetical protein